MSSIYRGEVINVTVFCGPEAILHGSEKTSRVMFQIGDSPKPITTRQAQELIILLQAAIIGWRGEI